MVRILPLAVLAAKTGGAVERCIEFDHEVATGRIPELPLPSAPAFTLGGNLYGVGGRLTTLRQCSSFNSEKQLFGWNWTRAMTAVNCSKSCKAPRCFADFSLASLSYGVGPWGSDRFSTSSSLPVDVTTLSQLLVRQNISWAWRDTAPPRAPGGSRRAVRFIHDFFLTSVRPNGTDVASTITDEIVINFASNPKFPGFQPPGCLDPHSRFGNVSRGGPIIRNAVFDGQHHYDYWYTDHHDAVPGTGTRYSSFRRVGAGDAGAVPPSKVDLMPFIAAVRKMWPAEAAGQWLGELSFSTELYDHCDGHVAFHEVPSIIPVPLVVDARSPAMD